MMVAAIGISDETRSKSLMQFECDVDRGAA